MENGNQFYERENAQGSIVSPVDSTGALVSRRFYDAYGVETTMQAGSRSRYGYAGAHGYAADGASGMLLAGARFYVPGIGRFLTPDPIGHSGGLNLYAYCDNNPVAKIDPQGTIPNAGSLINTMLNSWYSTTPFSKNYDTREGALQVANTWAWTRGYDKFEIGGFMTATLPEKGGYEYRLGFPMKAKGAAFALQPGTPPDHAIAFWHIHPFDQGRPILFQGRLVPAGNPLEFSGVMEAGGMVGGDLAYSHYHMIDIYLYYKGITRKYDPSDQSTTTGKP